MNIDFANLNKSYLEHKSSLDLAIKNVIESSSFIMGKEVFNFENNLCEFTGAKYSISCSNGTDALLLALLALDIKEGDEVITTPFTYISTAEVIARVGATPVFVDIDEASYNIDSFSIEDKITSKTRAIIVVSLFGQMSNMDKINSIAKLHGLFVIEDGAQSFGASYKGIKSGNCSTISTTSFFPAKPLGCYGDGGAIFTNSDDLSKKLKILRVHGQTKKYFHKYIGIAARLDTLQAAILNVKLDFYNEDILRRQSVANRYSELLKNTVVNCPLVSENNTSVWAQYVVRLNNRDEIQSKLFEKGIPTAIHYPIPLHLQECFDYLDYKKGDFPISEKVSSEIISLPMNPHLNIKEQTYIINELKKYI